MRTTFTKEETRRLDSKPAAYVLQDTEVRQMLINQTEQTTQRLLSKEIPLWPAPMPVGTIHRLCLTKVKDKPAPILLAPYRS